MPSWNIHTAHVERLLADHTAAELGIPDENAFLFGNFVPDIYVGYMVPDVSFHIDYCITHVTEISMIPISNADSFWDHYIAYRRPVTPAGLGLILGAWAHLVADRYYNGSFREFWATHDMPEGDQLRIRKQADFDLYGHTLGISRLTEATPELFTAAYTFCPYRIEEEDVKRSIEVANRIVHESAQMPACNHYQLLDAAWLTEVFELCAERLEVWLSTWQQLEREGARCLAADIRVRAGLAPLTPDDNSWMDAKNAKS